MPRRPLTRQQKHLRQLAHTSRKAANLVRLARAGYRNADAAEQYIDHKTASIYRAAADRDASAAALYAQRAAHLAHRTE